MGALILLLMVVSTKVQKDVRTEAVAEQALARAEREAEAEAARNAIPLPLPEDHPAFQSEAAEFVIAVPSPAKQLLPPPPPQAPDRTREKEHLRKQWESKLAVMQENWASLQQRLQAGQKLVSRSAQQEADLAAELARLQTAINTLQAEKGELKQEVKTVQTTKQTIAQQVAELQAELQRLKTETAEQADKFQLVPYVGSSPTRRRPIIIECEAKTVRFASEEISLTARDLSGFSGEYNPVRAGTEALLAYWETARQKSSSLSAKEPEPYLLFVIRPGGTVSYYVARRMLEGLSVDSGYELVSQSQELLWPVTTPDAKSACQAAIDEVIGARNRLAANPTGGRLPVADELQYEGQGGEFVLLEVQKLRHPEPKTFLGGQRITRQERSRSGFPGYKPPTAPERGGFVGPRLDDLKDELGNLPRRPPPAQDGLAGHPPGQGRPFPTQPPPRTGRGRSGGVASTDPTGPASNVAHGPGRPLQPGEESQPSGDTIDLDRLLAMTPEERKRLQNAPSAAREPVGNFGESGPGRPGPGNPEQGIAEQGGVGQGEPGRGAGQSSGEATSQFGDRGEINDLLSSATGRPDAPRGKSRAPLLGVNPDGQPQVGHPGGDRTSAVETTDDPSLAGDWEPNGVVGGKGTFSGEGGSSPAAPDSIPVQRGAAAGPSQAAHPQGSAGPSDSTEAMLAEHLPRPLPLPAANSIAAERSVTVTVDSTHIQIGHHEIPIEEGMSSRDLETRFSKELATVAKRWGRPPVGFHWQPALRFRVLPGGNQYYSWLQSASEEWELRNSVEHVFE